MVRSVCFVACFSGATAISLAEIERVIQAGPFLDEWESLQQQQVPQWYVDGKFGFYTHWGIYSVPAYGGPTFTKGASGEWFPRNMYQKQSPEHEHFEKTYGQLSISNGYKEFIPSFTGEDFNAKEWMTLFHRAGARFAGPVGEHHDGFAMYNCSLSHYNALNMGPKRDVVAELKEASESFPDLHFLVSSHRAWHSSFYDGGRSIPESDVNQCVCSGGAKAPDDADFCTLYCPANPDETNPTEGFMKDWLLRTCEIIEKYSNEVMWFDWWFSQSEVWKPYLKKMAAYYYNTMHSRGLKGVINTKYTSMPRGAGVLDYERGQACRISPDFWQTDTSISELSWGYVDGDSYKSASSIIENLVDIVSKNGALLMNVGPAKNGTIPEAAKSSFLEIGDWLATNGEAIYGSRPFHLFGEGPTLMGCGAFASQQINFTKADFRFTAGKGSVFAVAMGAVGGDAVTIKSLGKSRATAGEIRAVEVLGWGPVRWTVTDAGLRAELPREVGRLPVIAVRGLGDVQWDGIVRQGWDGSIALDATDSDSLRGGSMLDVVEGCAGSCSGSRTVVGGLAGNRNVTTEVAWKLRVKTAGMYVPTMKLSSPNFSTELRLTIGDAKSTVTVPATRLGEFIDVMGSSVALRAGDVRVTVAAEAVTKSLPHAGKFGSAWVKDKHVNYFDGCTVDGQNWLDLGKTATMGECFEACKANERCQAATWHDFTQEHANFCVGRTDGFYRPANSIAHYSIRRSTTIATDACVGSSAVSLGAVLLVPTEAIV